jgi:hypothetical protein
MERTFTLDKALNAVAAAALLFSIVGCTSLVGGSYDYSKNTAKPLEGVPFTLNKPVPKVTHTIAADSGKETYQVGFDWVADNTKRYTLQIKPSMLASVDFLMTFDAGGSLTEASAKSTDQTGQLIATVGKLALLTIGDKSKDDPQAYSNVLGLGDDYAARTNSAAAWAPIKAQFQQLGTTSKIQSEYVYDDSPQLTFLRAFSADLKIYAINAKGGAAPLGRNTGYDIFKGVLDKFGNDFTEGPDKKFAKETEGAFAAGDIKKLKDQKTEQVAALATQRAAFASSKTQEIQDQITSTLEKVRLLKSAIENTRPEIVLVAELADMSLSDWQKRVLAPIAKDITAKQQLLRVAEASSQPQGVLDAMGRGLDSLMRRKASVLGVLPEYDRRQALTKRLEGEMTAKDLKAIREERDALDVTIAAAEPPKAKAKAAVADDPATAAYLEDVPGTTTPSSAQVLNKLDGELKGVRPRYVIVVRDALPEKGPKPAAVAAAAAAAAIAPVAAEPAASQPNPQANPGGSGGRLETPVAPTPPPKVNTGNASNDKKD